MERRLAGRGIDPLIGAAGLRMDIGGIVQFRPSPRTSTRGDLRASSAE